MLFRDVNGSERTPKVSNMDSPLTGKLLYHDISLLLSKFADKITTVWRADLGTVVTKRTSTLIVWFQWSQSAKLLLMVIIQTTSKQLTRMRQLSFHFDCGIMWSVIFYADFNLFMLIFHLETKVHAGNKANKTKAPIFSLL